MAEFTCEFAKEVRKELGKNAVCYPARMYMTCEYENDSQYKCRWGTVCPKCGKKRVRAYDPCWGWHDLCMNQKCGMDK